MLDIFMSFVILKFTKRSMMVYLQALDLGFTLVHAFISESGIFQYSLVSDF